MHSPEAWIRTVAVHRLRAGWRHAAVVRRYQPKVPGPQVPVEVGPHHVALVAALARLDFDQRLVVVLHHVADLGTEEIAALLGSPRAPWRIAFCRARTRLARLLEERESR